MTVSEFHHTVQSSVATFPMALVIIFTNLSSTFYLEIASGSESDSSFFQESAAYLHRIGYTECLGDEERESYEERERRREGKES